MANSPFVHLHEARIPAVSTAGNDATSVAFVADTDGVISSVTYAPDGTMTGSATARTLTVTNKGQTGVGTASVATLALTSGVNLTGYDEGALALSATPANLVVAKGDVLAFASVHVSTGIADPGGLLRVGLTPTY